MHVQIVTYRLQGLSAAAYGRLCRDLAPALAEVPGLLTKVWVADVITNTYGGVYLWRTHQAMEAFVTSGLFRAEVGHHGLADVTISDFSTLTGPTRITGGLINAGL